jgi:hypothetical protein
MQTTIKTKKILRKFKTIWYRKKLHARSWRL